MTARLVEVRGEFARARAEWLVTNGAGAYASSTVAGLHTRRHHGLLVASLGEPLARRAEPRGSMAPPSSAKAREPEREPFGRHVIVSSLDTTLYEEDARGQLAHSWDLSVHRFPGRDPETTPLWLERFELAPLPTATYRVPRGELTIAYALALGRNTLVVRYDWRGDGAIQAAVRPLLALRHFHDLSREFGGMQQTLELRAAPGPLPGRMRIRPRKELPPITFSYRGTFVGSPDWWRRFVFDEERARGLDHLEDLWTPGVVELTLGDEPSWLVVSLGEPPLEPPDELFDEARRAKASALPSVVSEPAAHDGDDERGADSRRAHDELTAELRACALELARAGLDFLATSPRRGEAPPWIVAGYPWFECWGRDSWLALPGLTFEAGRLREGLALAEALALAAEDGALFQRVEDKTGSVDFTTADASLWLLARAWDLAEVLSAHPTSEARQVVLGSYYPAARAAFHALASGALPFVVVLSHGLVAARGSAALTWMGAQRGTDAVTPREGCAIELTALWVRGCRGLARLAREAAGFDVETDALAAAALALLQSPRFFDAEGGYAFDVLPADLDVCGADRSVRPNAVLALGLCPDLLPEAAARQVLSRAHRDLVTPVGLRTQSPRDPRYVGQYAGDAAERDRGYHQGSAWPFLVGAWVDAELALASDLRETARALAPVVLSAAQASQALGQVGELCDGDAPHAPGGAVASAISVAELLRAARALLRVLSP